jgi:hypothetical protein
MGGFVMYKQRIWALSIAALLLTSGSCLAAASSSSNNQSFEISLKDYHINYQEAIDDREDGWVTGFRLAYKNQNPNNHSYWRVFYESTNHSDHYDGAYQDGTPVQTTTDNTKKTGEIIFANPIGDSTNTFAYIGVGNYRWDRNITGSGGYLEKYSWNYIPIGYRNEYKINNSWQGAVDLAVRFPFNSKMTAYTDPDLTFTLGAKPGFKAEFPLTHPLSKQWTLQITPWYEYWGIKQSNSIPIIYQGQPGYAYEPDSHTNQYGFDLGLTYNF